MVKIVAFSMTMASASVDDSTSLLQVSAGVRQSQTQRVLTAVADAGQDTVCVQAAIGDVAPVTGSFTANKMTVEVAAGSVAEEAGSFCVPKQDVLLMQRTLGLNTAGDIEAALGAKTTTTTTTSLKDLEENWDFDAGGAFIHDGHIKAAYVVSDGQCESASHLKMKEQRGLQASDTLRHEGTMARKKVSDEERLRLRRQSKYAFSNTVKICKCRNFLKSSAELVLSDKLEEIAKIRDARDGFALLQRDLDTALGQKNKKATPTTTTTTTTTPGEDMWPQFMVLSTACTAASPEKFRSKKSRIQGCEGCSSYKTWWSRDQDEGGQSLTWGSTAKLLNDPEIVPLYKSSNITEGWQHCSRGWVVAGACWPYLAHLYEANNPEPAPTHNDWNKDYAQCTQVCTKRCRGPGCPKVQTICGCPGGVKY